MKKLVLLLFITSFSVVSSQNQKLAFLEIDRIVLDGAEFLGYDSFGFYYTIKNNVFSKIDTKVTLEYKNISLGKITKVDLKNPLKIVLFYENFNTVIIVDNQLNETQKINFSENSIPIVATAIGLASQNQLWVYNSMNQQLGLYDYLSTTYKTISVPFTESIKNYVSDFNVFHWIDIKNDWYMSDIFGKIISKGKVPDFESITIINENQFIYCNNSILILQDVEKETKTQIEISEKTFKKFYYKDQILSIFTATGITNYKITIP
ncbi:hypothetical protein SAMN05444395_10167 [Flavobacterium fryxellicola]|uniref:Glutamine cyclotransferase n=1 Tax=Flavobacterium fryxellicola TaxID=249352 RepID=A0A167U012_9FLAO|nr:hypothetical protein [Flavobacterium fryxellicola]OAB25121.1 hypothetical protein FBFR_15675 [Flavobacterium fryxellicola]SHN49600.1 hypothetical protein SAMN05444395_10167 [Flavobacterium fryxellicola]